MNHPKKSDLLTFLLETFFRRVFSEAVSALSVNGNKDDTAAAVVETLVQGCLDNYNVKLLLNYGLKELRKDINHISAVATDASGGGGGGVEFPPVIVDHYNVRDAVNDSWKSTPPGKEGKSAPEISIESAASEMSIMEELSSDLARVQPVRNLSWKSAAAFQLDVREVVEKCVKWSISNLPFRNEDDTISRRKSWNVEICLKNYSESLSCSANTTTEQPPPEEAYSSGQMDSKVLLAKMLTKIFTTLGYSVVGEGKNYTVIPSSVIFPNVLVAFSNSESGERIFVEKDPRDFYTKYSGGVVILYNYARLKSILDKYDTLIKSEDYPPFPPLEDVDFSTLGQSKEEVAVIFMLFLWPRALSNVVNLGRNSADKVNTSFLFDFVKTFAKTYDEYYNHVMVIVPKTTPHNFGTMAARLWLLKALGKVFEQFMDLAAMEVERISED